MISFDMRTVIVCYVLVSLICAVVMARQWQYYHSRYPGLGFWVLDYVLQFLGLCLVIARGAIPDGLSLTLGNVFLMGGLVFLLHGLRLYFGKSSYQLADWGAFALFVGAHGWYTVVSPNLAAREIAFSVAMIFVSGRSIAVVGRGEARLRAISKGPIVVFGAFCLASLARIGLNLLGPRGSDFFASGSRDSVIMATYLCLFIALTFSLVVMVGRRINLDQEGIIASKTRVEGELRSSEEKFYKAFQASPNAVSISRLRDGRFIEVNDAFCRLSGYTRAEVLSDPPIDVWGDEAKRRDFVKAIVGSSLVSGYEMKALRKDGRRVHVDLSGGIVELNGEEHLITLVSDLSLRERADMILRVRLSLREYALGHSTEEIMAKALEEIETMTGSSIGFYHIVDEDKGVLTRQAWSGRTLREFCAVEGQAVHYPLAKAGIWADCIREKRPIIHNDYSSLAQRKGLPPGHAAVIRELVAPTLRDGKVMAVLGVGNKAEAYDEEDVALVSYIVDLVWTIVVQKQTDERVLELNRRLEEQAMTDELTGIANRRAFFALASQELQRSKRYGTPFCFLMVDIDKFKSVNDAYGHEAGDAVLRLVATTLRAHVRDFDLTARLGGEEFGVLLPNTKLGDALSLAERLRAGVGGASCEIQGRALGATVSIGVSGLAGEEDDLEAVMRRADRAMYKAKELGRNRVEEA